MRSEAPNSGYLERVATPASSVTAARELDELYRLHAAEVFRYAYAVLGNRADAEDVTQTTFVNALRALERGDRPRKPTNWLITIAHNLIRQRFRQQQSRPPEVELDRDVAAAEATDDGPSIDELVHALQRIPPTQRQALVLRELEGRSYGEIGELLGVSQSALEALIFRARRSLADELENLVTCDRAELALTRASDGRIGRKERRRLLAHIDECTSCARVAARSIKYRRAFKALAILPLPFSLTLFKGAPSAYAAAGLPTIGAGTAAGVGGGAVSAKIAVGLAAVAVAGGAGYEGVKAVQEPTKPAAKVVKAAPVASMPAATKPVAVAAVTPRVTETTRKPIAAHATVGDRPGRAAKAKRPERGRSAAAPGQTKTTVAATPKTSKPAKTPKPTPAAAAPREKAKEKAPAKPVQTPKAEKPKAVHVPKPKAAPPASAPAVEPVRGKSAAAPGQLNEPEPAKGKAESSG